MTARIGACDLDLHRAQAIVSNFEGDKPYTSKFEFIQALAALTRVFHDDVQNKTEAKSKKLKDVLMSAAAPDRVEWYFNNSRLRHSMRRSYTGLLSSGTSSNESLHFEMNKWFRNQQEIYISTLTLQLRINWIGKLMVHNAALYAPLRRTNFQKTLLIALAAKWEFGDNDAWEAWLATDLVLPLEKVKKQTRQSLKARGIPRRICYKRPAYECAVITKTKKKIKRTPTNLLRIKI